MKKKFAFLLSAFLLSASILPMNASVSAAKANDAPQVIPAIREWEGSEGSFIPDSSTVLVNASGSSSVEKVQGFFVDTLSIDVSVSEASSGTNEIVFMLDDSLLSDLGEEGYTVTATESKIEIRSATDVGLLYGGITVVQSVYASGFFPCGNAVDYPAYPTRAGMIDVARLYMPINSLMDITKYMAWYKLNEIHVHINDNGQNNYSGFRLESDVPGLTSKDGYYTKDEYRQYQLDALDYGITVITEIDSPYHSACFANVELGNESPKLLSESDGVEPWIAGRTLDIRDETTVKFIENLFTEYLGGDNPVFIGDTVHIGMDEFPATAEFKSAMEAYLNRIIKHVNSFGYKARFWSGMGTSGCLNGAVIEEGLNFDTNYWDFDLSGPTQTVALDCDIINTVNTYLYIVPGKTNAVVEDFEDYFGYDSLKFIYEKWQANYYSVWASKPEILPENDEHMKGACFAIWNDYGSSWYGVTYHDVVDRFRGAVSILAEKTWYGNTNGKISFDNFYDRYLILSERDGFVDLFNRALPEGGINIGFDSDIPDYALLNGGEVANGELILDGSAYLSLTPSVYGFPNTLGFDITLDEYPSERTALFSGYDTEGVDIFIDTDGTVGFKSKISESDAYVFTFAYKLPLGEKTTLTFTCDMFNTKMIVNGGACYDTINDHADLVPEEVKDRKYSTLTIPLSKIGAGIKGKLDNLSVSSEAIDFSAYTFGSTLSRESTVTASSCLNEEKYPPANVTDNSQKERFMFSDDADEQWLTVDLGRTSPVYKIEISFYRAVGNYEIHVSENGTDFTKVYEIKDGSEGKGKIDEIKLDKAYNARYVKYVQLKRIAEDNTSGGINEIRVFAPDAEYYSEYFTSVANYFKAMDDSDPRKELLENKALQLDELLKAETVYIGSVAALCNEIDALMHDSDEESALPADPSESSPDTSDDNSKPVNLPLIGGIIAAVAVIAGICAIIIKKRKKNNGK